MQAEEPLIHKLHDLLSEMLLKLLGRIAQPKTLIGLTKITVESFDVKNLLPIDEVILSNDITEALKDCKDVDKSKIRLNYRNNFKANCFAHLTEDLLQEPSCPMCEIY